MFKEGFSKAMEADVLRMLKQPSWAQPWIDRAIAERHKRLHSYSRKLTMKKGWKRGTTGQV